MVLKITTRPLFTSQKEKLAFGISHYWVLISHTKMNTPINDVVNPNSYATLGFAKFATLLSNSQKGQMYLKAIYRFFHTYVKTEHALVLLRVYLF